MAMFAVKNIRFLVTFICCVFFTRAEVKYGECGNKYIAPEWLSPSGIPPPGRVDPDLFPELQGVVVRVTNRTDNMTLSLFALPFVESAADCPQADKTVYHKLRKYWRNYTLIKGEDEDEPVHFAGISTGCYYFELANSTNDKWIWDVQFFNTNYQYRDTQLNCESRFDPSNGDKPMQLTYKLSLGLTCLQLRCALYERSTIDSNILDELDNKLISPSRECIVTYIREGTPPSISCSRRPYQNLTLISQDSVSTDGREGWATVVTWKNLKKSGAYYYTKFTRHSLSCDMKYQDLANWNSAVQIGAIIHGYQNQTNIPRAIDTNYDLHVKLVTIVMGIILLSILAYWAVKYAKVVFPRERVSVDSDTKPQTEDVEITSLNVGKVSDAILLIYAKDSPQFMEKMEEFRSHLQYTCGSRVHDVYSPDDQPELAKIGVSDWVRQRLSDNGKVVWIDTPQFRSLFDGRPHPNTDFRDNAIPYAVKLATDLFQDPATQYRRHFVVRMESLQVGNGRADPLLVISPHKRYYIPQHLDQLCGHLIA